MNATPWGQVGPTPNPDFSPALSAYAGREGVKQVQTALRDRGFDPGPIDGIIGPRTRAATRAFQEAAGVPVTGHPLSAPTLVALFGSTSSQEAPVPDSASLPPIVPHAPPSRQVDPTQPWIVARPSWVLGNMAVSGLATGLLFGVVGGILPVFTFSGSAKVGAGVGIGISLLTWGAMTDQRARRSPRLTRTMQRLQQRAGYGMPGTSYAVGDVAAAEGEITLREAAARSFGPMLPIFTVAAAGIALAALYELSQD